ncbi:MAG: TIGR03016 family PEP-CTERM system-associated outer membrane protein [Methylotenera sp.]|nr:TIGR03016 family PEP-CTERM system-associated outer membrane protein [Methylotenera sp.]
MVLTPLHATKHKSVKLLFSLRFIGFLYSVFNLPVTYALSWTFTPSVQIQEIYSDNVRLARSGSEQSSFVTSINPGFSTTVNTPRTTFNLNYRLQSLYNSAGNNNISLYNQLQSSSQTTIIPNSLFLSSSSSISQQNINNNRLGADNINGFSNSTNAYTFNISPYWTPRFLNYATGSARINASSFSTSGGGAINNEFNSVLNSFNTDANTLSDSFNLTETINLTSGTYFNRLKWNISFNNNESYRTNTANVSFQNSTARVSTSFNQKFSVFAQGGYSNNNFQSITGDNDSGIYYTFGGQWQPSQLYSITAGMGNNSYVTFYISPFSRLKWTTTYTNNAVGTNFGNYSGGGTELGTNLNSGQYQGINGGGNSGSNWQTLLNYQTRRSTWSISHTNNTVTSQQLLAQTQIFPNQNQSGNIDPNQRIFNNPNLNNEVIVTKVWNLSASFTTGKSTINASVFDQNFEYQASGLSQKSIGINGGWNWQFSGKTNAYFRPQWQHIKSQGIANRQSYTLAIGLNQAITSRLNGNFEFRHINQTSGQNSDLFEQSNGFANNYQENRATASLSMRF